MGVQNKRIVSDSQLTDGSHWYNRETHAAKSGRLFNAIHAGAWCGGYDSFQRTSGKLLFILFKA